MNTDIEYLRQLETDLNGAVAREVARREEARSAATPPARRRAGQMWMKVAGIAAAFIVVAGAIGFVAGGDDEAGRFQQVGDAVAGDGGSGSAPQPPAPEPSATTVPGDERLGEAGYGLDDDARRRQQQDLSKIVRDGRIGIVVPDEAFVEAVGDLTFIAERHGGFILSSSTQNNRSGTFVLRIPATRFDRALVDVRELGTGVRFEQIRGEDVTAEYIDFQARLRILKAQRALLFDLFEQADTTEEILRMARQLDDVRLRIEQIQGQLRFINDQVAESTLRVSIQERNAPETMDEAEVDNPDLGSSVDLAVQGFLRIVGAVIVGLGYLIPLTVLGALVWMALWLFRRRRATV
jgi:Domain of unknown function (DUF4349)